MTDISARVICDSIGEHSPRLTTFLTRYPKFVHAEHMRHRTGSYCVSSSRAIPVSKNLEEVRSDELRAGPVWWGREQKGMQSGEELSTEEMRLFQFWKDDYDYSHLVKTPKAWAQGLWKSAALQAALIAEQMHEAGAHKSIVNRLLEPFLHVNVLVTSCEPGLMNFFGLRLDKAAQPEIRALAEAMWTAWNESLPTKLKPGQWHLPFVGEYGCGFIQDPSKDGDIRVSVARCARLSYTSFETGRRSTIGEDLKLYDRLVGAHPIHASPAEHQATPDEWGVTRLWAHPELHGNLPGWVQYRKTLPGEAVAPLPESYRK